MVGFEQLEEWLVPLLNKQDKILLLGSGTSLVPVQLHEAGFCNVIAVDNSPSAMAKMQVIVCCLSAPVRVISGQYAAAIMCVGHHQQSSYSTYAYSCCSSARNTGCI